MNAQTTEHIRRANRSAEILVADLVEARKDAEDDPSLHMLLYDMLEASSKIESRLSHIKNKYKQLAERKEQA